MSFLRPAILLLVCPAFAPAAFAAPPAPDPAAAATSARHEAITHLEGLLRSFEGPGDTRIELALRLAVLYDEEAQALQKEGQEALPGVLDACVDDPAGLDACAAAHAPPALAAADRYTGKALRVLRSIVTGAPEHARAEEATWLYARILGEAGDPEAPAELRRLVRTWPQGPHAADAWLLLADTAFDHDDAGAAALAYQRALSFPDFARADYARYKLAWVWFNLDDLDAATAAMTLVVDSAAGTLRDEAITDQLRFFATAGQGDQAEAWLHRRGLDARLPAFYDALASTLEAKGDRAGAVVALRRSLALVDRPTAAGRVAELLRAAGDTDGALAEYGRMQRQYGPDSAWARAHAGEDPGTTALLRKAAATWHTEARKLRTGPGAATAYAAADRAYTLLATVDDPALRLAHAELQFATKQFGPAWEGYMAAARAGGKDAAFAASSAVFAAEALVKAEPATPAWTESEGRLVTAVDLAATLSPQDPKVRGMQYRAGWLLYQNDRLDEAVARFAVVIAADPTSHDAELAANLTLDALALQQDWATLATTADAFAQSPHAPPTLRAEAARIADNARFAAIEHGALEPLQKADAYYALAQTPSANAALAAHDAAVLYREAAHVREAIAAGSLAVTHPDAPTWRDDLRALAFDQESIADFSAAAATYERYAAIPGAPLATDALRSAMIFRDATGDLAHAAADGKALLKRAPTPTLRLELADVLDRAGDPAGALALRQEVARDTAAPLEARLAARVAWGRTLADPTAVYTEGLALWESQGAARASATDGAREAAGEMALALGAGRWTRYQALRVTGPADPSVRGEAATRILAAQLTAKLTALQAVEADTQRVIDTGSARYGVAALSRLGAAYEGFAAALGDAPVPAELEGDAREIYVDGVIDRMWALHQRAIAAYVAATDQARVASIVDPTVEVASDRLLALSGAAPLPAEALLPSRYTASGAVVATFAR